MSAKSDQIVPTLTIRVVIDMASLDQGVGHVSASLNLIPYLRNEYPNAIIELVPLHGSLNPAGEASGMGGLAYYAKHPDVLQGIDDDNTEGRTIGEMPITECLTSLNAKEKLGSAKNMLQQAVENSSGSVRIINLGDYLSMSNPSKVSENVVAVSGALDMGVPDSFNPSAHNNNYGSTHGTIAMQPIGWKKGITKCGTLPPLPALPSLESTVSSSPVKIVTLYKTFDPKNNMIEQTLRALHRIDSDARANDCKHVIQISGPLPDNHKEFKNLSFIKIDEAGDPPHSEMLKIFARSNLVITEGQNTAYEAAALATPLMHRPIREQADSVSAVVKKLNADLQTSQHDDFINLTMEKGESLEKPIDWKTLNSEALNVQAEIYKAPKHDSAVVRQIKEYITNTIKSAIPTKLPDMDKQQSTTSTAAAAVQPAGTGDGSPRSSSSSSSSSFSKPLTFYRNHLGEQQQIGQTVQIELLAIGALVENLNTLPEQISGNEAYNGMRKKWSIDAKTVEQDIEKLEEELSSRGARRDDLDKLNKLKEVCLYVQKELETYRNNRSSPTI